MLVTSNYLWPYNAVPIGVHMHAPACMSIHSYVLVLCVTIPSAYVLIDYKMSLFNAHLCRRGLNPPHRIKSISMTTFSEQEIKLLKGGGNEVHIEQYI